MYETTKQIEIKNKLLRFVKQNNKAEILAILYNELDKIRLTKENTIQFCECGYPISYEIINLNQKNEKAVSKPIILEYLLKEETDFESYIISYFCPNCNKLIDEKKY